MEGFEVDRLSLWAHVLIPTTGTPPELLTALFGLAGQVAGATVASITTLELPVVKYSGSFAINTIPQCSLSLALGRRLDTLSVSGVHLLQDLFRSGLKVFVQARVRQFHDSLPLLDMLGLGGAAREWHDRPFVVFEGTTSTCRYQRTTSGVVFDLGVSHWLEALTRSSSISALTHPRSLSILDIRARNPNFTRPGAPGGGSGSSLGGMAVTPTSSARRFIDFRNVENGLWFDTTRPDPEGILPWLLHEAETGRAIKHTIFSSALSRDVDFLRDDRNAAALEALRRFEPLASGGRYVDSVPLRLRRPPDTDTAMEQLLAKAISTAVASRHYNQLTSATMWQTLLSLSQDFFFAVIPLVDKALVVPFMKGLRDPWRTIDGADLQGISKASDVSQELRAVAVLGSAQPPTRTGALNGAAAVPSILGWYQGASRGQILWNTLPAWASSVGWPLSAALTTGARSPRSTAFSPGYLPPVLTALVSATLPTGLRRINTLRYFADRLAKAVYINEVLSHRQMELNCRLRFDIAPGSVVRVEGVPERFLAGNDNLAKEMYGTVLQVDTHFDAESPSAGTAYRLGNTRSKLENSLDAGSLESHPLWRDTWRGCKLVAET